MNELMSLDMLARQNTWFLLPEGILALGVMVVLVLTILTYKKARQENEAIMLTALFFVAASLLSLFWLAKTHPPLPAEPVMFGTLTADLLSYIFRGLLLLGCGLTVMVAHRYLEQNTRVIGDFYILTLGATLGAMILASASDLIAVFVGLETLSITSYILAGYLRRTARSAEASFKYLIYGGMGTAVFLFGTSLLYGLTGSTNFGEISAAVLQYQDVTHPTLVLLMVMVFAALAFKLSAAPFHMWTPDVYEGAPTPVSAFLSVVSKAGALAITLRMVVVIFSRFDDWTMLWMMLAVLSMTLGNFVALKQRNIKRLLAYSTIAHAGYMLLGLAVGSTGGIGALVYYFITYVFMNTGAFACAIYFSTLTRTDDIEAYRGLIHKKPALVLALSICLLSLAGIPITAGFFGKFFLFQAVAAVSTGYLWLVGIALINSTISLAYYLNIIRLMVIKEPSSVVAAIDPTEPTPMVLTSAVALSVLGTLVLGIYAAPFFELSRQSVEQLADERASVVSQNPDDEDAPVIEVDTAAPADRGATGKAAVPAPATHP